jgi:triacylglycerol lipase
VRGGSSGTLDRGGPLRRRALALLGAAALSLALGGSLTTAALVAPEIAVGGGPGTAARADVPVLLVPGWLDTARDLAALRIRFLAAGWSHVETLTFRDPTGSNREHALEIGAAVERIVAETGSAEIDIVAHSMGGLATRWYLLTGDDPPVRRAAFLGSPHQGTLAAHFAWGDGGDEMTPGSEFLQELNAAPPVPDGVAAMTVRTPIDTRVVPGESAMLLGVADHTVCCPTHTGLIRDDEVFALVVDFLEGPAGTPPSPSP